MPIVQYRALAARGILHDPSPYDLGSESWSGGSNVLFQNTRAIRSPVFREIKAALEETPVYVVGLQVSSGWDRIVYVGNTGRIRTWSSGTTVEVTPSGFTPAAFDGRITSAFLGDVLYINNPTQGLYYMGPVDTLFARDPQWDATWHCKVFRVFKDYPIALNVVKGTASFPTMVKWGTNTLAGQTTATWDHTNPNYNAGENIIADLTSELLDGMPLRDAFVMYSREQVWEAVLSGGLDVFQFRRLFSEGGIIATNAVAEAAGRHYVFGPNDIYVHDGIDKQSLVSDRNKSWIFQHLDAGKADRCFVQHFPMLSSVIFGYVSFDDDVVYKDPTVGCNKGFVYNYENGTHGFIDLPNVTSMSIANLNTILTWANAGTLTWDQVGGSWADIAGANGRGLVAVSAAMTGVSTPRLCAYDLMDKGRVAFPYVDELNPAASLERIGIDLDEQGGGLSLYKLVRRVFPQVVMFRDVPVTIRIGGSQTPSGLISWGPVHTYNPSTDYKIDDQRGGRYIAFRFSVQSPADFEVTGYDIDVDNNGVR